MLIATPVGARNAEQLHRLNLTRIRQVRPAAQIREVPLRVERYATILKPFDQLYLVRIPLLPVRRQGLRLRHAPARERITLARQLLHLRLYASQIILGYLPIAKIDIVVETRLDRRPYRQLRAGEKGLHRLSHQMRR